MEFCISTLITREEKLRKLEAVKWFIEACGFTEFNILERQEVVDQVDLEKEDFSISPAKFWQQEMIAVIDLDYIDESVEPANRMEHCILHELCHYLLEVQWREAGPGLISRIKRKAAQYGASEAFPDDAEAGFFGDDELLCSMWECFVNEMTYILLMHYERAKFATVANYWYTKKRKESLGQVHWLLKGIGGSFLDSFAEYMFKGIRNEILDPVFQNAEKSILSNHPIYQGQQDRSTHAAVLDQA